MSEKEQQEKVKKIIELVKDLYGTESFILAGIKNHITAEELEDGGFDADSFVILNEVNPPAVVLLSEMMSYQSVIYSMKEHGISQTNILHLSERKITEWREKIKDQLQEQMMKAQRDVKEINEESGSVIDLLEF